MNVLNVCLSTDLEHGGGTGERTLQMSRALARHNVACTVLELGFAQTTVTDRRDHGIRIVSLPRLSKRFYVPRLPRSLVRGLVQEADIVHLIGHWTPLNAVVARLARRMGTPYVVCPAGALPIYGRSRLLKGIYNLLVGRAIVQNAAACIAITKDEISHFGAYGILDHDVVVVPNGVAIPEDAPIGDDTFRHKHGLPGKPFVLFVGRLNPIKGADLLLEAFAAIHVEMPEMQLVFAGPDGGLKEQLIARVSELGIPDKVHFIGYVEGGDKAQAFISSQLLVIPSRHEAMSIVVLEAGIWGTPVLITDQCGFDEVAEVDGGQVVPATVEGLRDGLAKLLSNTRRLAEMGYALRTHVQKKYDWDSLIEKILCIYDKILYERRQI